jgi:hypothetical protein
MRLIKMAEPLVKKQASVTSRWFLPWVYPPRIRGLEKHLKIAGSFFLAFLGRGIEIERLLKSVGALAQGRGKESVGG